MHPYLLTVSCGADGGIAGSRSFDEVNMPSAALRNSRSEYPKAVVVCRELDLAHRVRLFSLPGRLDADRDLLQLMFLLCCHVSPRPFGLAEKSDSCYDSEVGIR